MATCVKCGAALIAQARFCATCGSPVTRTSIPPAVPAAKSVAISVPDPFARTVLGENVAAVIEAAQASPISPLAASHMAAQGGAAPAPSPAYQAPVAYVPQPAPPPMQSIPPGTMVLVYWADGQRYPGTVLQVSAQHLFVAFPNGIQQWIDVRYITVGG